MTKQHLLTCVIAIATLAAPSTVLAQRDIQETRQEVRQEARIEARTEARIDNRRNAVPNNNNNIIIINNAMLKTVSYKGIVLLHDSVNQRFYRAVGNGYEVYNVPYGAQVVELSPATPTKITLIQ